jgi:hypothetical protein
MIPIQPEDVAFDAADEAQWCAVAAVPQLDASVNQPLQSSVPTLVFSGRYDPITPAQFGDAVLPGLPNSRHVVFARTAHGSFVSNDCAGQIAMAFLDQPARNWTELTAICDITQKATFATSQTIRQTPFLYQLLQGTATAMSWFYLIIAVSCLLSSVFIIRPLKMLYKTIRGITTPPLLQQLHWAELIAAMSALSIVSYITYIAVDSSLNMDGYGIIFGIPTAYNALPVLLYSLPLSIFVLWYAAYRLYTAPLVATDATPRQPTTPATWQTFTYASIILLSSVVLLATLLFNGIYGGWPW